LEAEVKASAVVRQQRDAIHHESDLRDAEIAELRSELEKYQSQNLALKTSQDDLEVLYDYLDVNYIIILSILLYFLFSVRTKKIGSSVFSSRCSM
jgi:hypothetical protein